jgi:hypothetical protein
MDTKPGVSGNLDANNCWRAKLGDTEGVLRHPRLIFPG